MAKLYEIEADIERVLALREPDAETGELPANIDELDAELLRLCGNYNKLIEYLIKAQRNAQSDARAFEEEEDVFKAKRIAEQKHADNLLAFIVSKLGQTKGRFGDFTYNSYVRGEKADVANEDKVLAILRDKHPECVTMETTYSINRNNLKLLLQSGEKVEGADLLPIVVTTIK